MFEDNPESNVSVCRQTHVQNLQSGALDTLHPLFNTSDHLPCFEPDQNITAKVVQIYEASQSLQGK